MMRPSRTLLFVALFVATPGLGFAIYKTVSTPPFLLTEGPNLSVPVVTTTPLETAKQTVLVGRGDKDDPCTVEIHKDVLAEMEEMGIREWADACEEAHAQTQ